MYKKSFFALISLTVGCIIGFSIAEVLTRIFAPQMTGPVQYAYHEQLGSIHVPNQHARRTLPGVYDYIYTNNSLGLRSTKEYSFQKSADLRILLLGDSFTYGIGVNDDETFAYKLEEKLSNDNWHTEVINAGNGGKGTDYALKFFKVLGYKFKPDLTILCFYANDFGDNERGDYFIINKDGSLHEKLLSDSIISNKDFLRKFPLYNWLISWSHFANLMKWTAIKFILRSSKSIKKASEQGVVHYSKNQDGYYSNNVNIRLTKIFIEKLVDEVRNHGSDFMVFYIPSKEEVLKFRLNAKVSQDELELKNILKSLNMDVFSFTPVLAKSNQSIENLYYIEGHWTALSHELAANFMSTCIKERLKIIFL